MCTFSPEGKSLVLPLQGASERDGRLTEEGGQAILKLMTVITEQSMESEIREIFQNMGTGLRGYRIILFGSRARGSAGSTSDFDVGVLGDHLNRANEKLRQQALKEGKVLCGLS